MFTKNLIFLFFLVVQVIGADALPVSMIKNRVLHAILINEIQIKPNSVSRIKKLEIPFTSWIAYHYATIDGAAYCPDNILSVTVGSKKWSLWRNELGVWGIVIDTTMPSSPNDNKPLLLKPYSKHWSSSAILHIHEENLVIQI